MPESRTASDEPVGNRHRVFDSNYEQSGPRIFAAQKCTAFMTSEPTLYPDWATVQIRLARNFRPLWEVIAPITFSKTTNRGCLFSVARSWISFQKGANVPLRFPLRPAPSPPTRGLDKGRTPSEVGRLRQHGSGNRAHILYVEFRSSSEIGPGIGDAALLFIPIIGEEALPRIAQAETGHAAAGEKFVPS